MQGENLKVLTIGAGYFAQLHLDSWARNARVTLVGLVDPDQDKAKALLSSLGVEVPVFANLEAALQATDPDIIDIATPPDTHSELIEQAAAATPPAIICQKPFCGGLDPAQTTLARHPDQLIIVHENFRFQPWYRETKRHLGSLGHLYQITFQFRPGDGQGAAAYLDRQPYFQTMPRFLVHETAIHWIDVFRFLLDHEPTSVYADLRTLNPSISGEDAGQIILDFGGTRALFDGNRLSDHAATNTRLTMGEMLIEGDQGSLRLNGKGELWLRRHGTPRSHRFYRAMAPKRFGDDCVHHFQSHVVDHLLDGARLETRAQDYLKNQQLEELVYQSAKKGRNLAVQNLAV